MADQEHLERAILDAWHGNARPWICAVQGHAIDSRRLVTDRAIVDAVMAHAPKRIIDLGCGEGWLVRELCAKGIDGLGVDAVPELLAAAESSGIGRYRQLSYAQLAAGMLQEQGDVVACNFSLIGGGSVDALLAAIPSMLAEHGTLIVQTLHPIAAVGDAPYEDGWREGSWAGCGEGFGEAAPWYFRTLSGWMAAFSTAKLSLVDLCEPTHPSTGRPASIIFTLRPYADPGNAGAHR